MSEMQISKETILSVIRHGARTLGELGPPPSREAFLSWRADPQRPIVPHGCQWFRDCGQCRWEDCIVEVPVRYGSEQGERLRGAMFLKMRKAGVSVPRMAEFFYLSKSHVTNCMAKAEGIGVDIAEVRDLKARQMLKVEAVNMRQSGKSERQVAAALGVSARHVRRMCHGVAGIERNVGNRHRKEPPGAGQRQTEGMLAGRVAVLKAYFK